MTVEQFYKAQTKKAKESALIGLSMTSVPSIVAEEMKNAPEDTNENVLTNIYKDAVRAQGYNYN